MLHSMLHVACVVMFSLALGFCLAFGLVRYQTGKPRRNRRHLLANAAPAFSVTPYDPNGGGHKEGRVTFLCDAAITQRWSLVTVGATPGKTIKANLAGTVPIGVIDDTTDTLTGDLGIPVGVGLFGSAGRTLKVLINSTVTAGDWLIADTSNPIYGMTDPFTGASASRFGRATQSGVAGQVIEFDPDMPSGPLTNFAPIAAGEGVVGSTSTTADAIAIAGLLSTDVAIVQLNARGGSETILTAATAAGQINVTLSAAATQGTTKYNYMVLRGGQS